MNLYEEYGQQLAAFKSKMKPADGMFGMGVGIGEAPCHDEFARKLEQLLLEMAADACFQNSREVLDYVYQAPLEAAEQSAYWMMMAVHKLTLPLIGRLNQKEAGDLLAWYENAYPRADRLPPQNDVLKALRERGQVRSRSIFGWRKK